MAYEKIGWKDYPDKTTPMNAKNFTHMDEGIFENSVAIGETSKIAEIGDGTCAGAIVECFQSVSDGKAAVAAALTNQGVATANDATFATLAENVETVGTNKYNAGMTDADDRVNTDSLNYQTGYDSGYNAGYTAGGTNKYTLTAQTVQYTPATTSGYVESINFNFPHGVAGLRNAWFLRKSDSYNYTAAGTIDAWAFIWGVSGNTLQIKIKNTGNVNFSSLGIVLQLTAYGY